jgi:uncharacterized protein (TIGR01777 family)
MNKKIIITGATGLIGSHLCMALTRRGDSVTVFSRNVESARRLLGNNFDYVNWDYKKPNEWQNSFDNHDAIIHLAGANLSSQRWTRKYKAIILESRVEGTKSLVEALKKLQTKIKVFISSSAVGYYGSRSDKILTEESESGSDFLARVCVKWEKEAQKADELGIRTAILRQGVVFSSDVGALKKFLLPFKFFVGGPLGTGNQWFPWIHINDLVAIYLFILDNSEILGAVNAVSSDTVRMNDFARTLGRVLNKPSIFKVPEFALRILVGEVTSSIVASQKVIPKKLIEYGFKYEFEVLEKALKDLLKTKRA